jgi:CheY-like chemotaxis protein
MDVSADAKSKLRILLVERDPIDAAVLVQLMRAGHHALEVVTAESFSAALDLLQREPIDTIFCSVAGGEMAVFQALVRTAKPRPVVALIAEAESALRDHATEVGAVRVLLKEHLLASFVHRVLRAAEGYPDKLPAYA